MLLGLDHPDLKVKLKSCEAARKSLSRERTPSINAVIEAGLVPRLVECLGYNDWYVPYCLQTINMYHMIKSRFN